MRVAVTGHDGFLGSNMVRFLEKKGHRVDKGLSHEADVVMHFAANHGGVGYIASHEYEVAKDNIELDINVIDWCQQTGQRLFYPSSACIYPDHHGEPQGVYGYEKLLFTKLSEHTPFDMRVGILGTVFGPRQKTGEKGKFPVDICLKVIEAAKNKYLRGDEFVSDLKLWGDGKQVRTFLYVTDALEMIYEVVCADHYDGPVNIASEEQITVKEVADALAKHAGFIPQYQYDTSKPSGAQERREDMAEWNSRYRYCPQTTTAEGFLKLYDWLQKNYETLSGQPPTIKTAS